MEKACDEILAVYMPKGGVWVGVVRERVCSIARGGRGEDCGSKCEKSKHDSRTERERQWKTTKIQDGGNPPFLQLKILVGDESTVSGGGSDHDEDNDRGQRGTPSSELRSDFDTIP